MLFQYNTIQKRGSIYQGLLMSSADACRISFLIFIWNLSRAFFLSLGNLTHAWQIIQMKW